MRSAHPVKPKKTEAIRVRLDENLKTRLEHLALIQSLDLSDVARMAFVFYLAKHQQPVAA